MAKFGRRSSKELATCDERLQKLFREVVKHYDCTVLTGHRSEVSQNQKYQQGLSKVRYPKSKHNAIPSQAADVVPYPIKWPDNDTARVVKSDPKLREYVKDLARFYHFAGFVEGIASQQGVEIRFGGDWDGDRVFLDNLFDDLPHMELEE